MRNSYVLVGIVGVVLILWVIGTSFAFAEVVSPVPKLENHIEISRLGANSNGHTSFSTEKMKWMHWFNSGRRTSETMVKGLQFYHIAKSLSMGFHPAPRKQFLLIIQGTLRIEASNGEKRNFSPGSIVLLEDIAGTKGHISRVIGPEDVYAAVMPVP